MSLGNRETVTTVCPCSLLFGFGCFSPADTGGPASARLTTPDVRRQIPKGVAATEEERVVVRKANLALRPPRRRRPMKPGLVAALPRARADPATGGGRALLRELDVLGHWLQWASPCAGGVLPAAVFRRLLSGAAAELLTEDLSLGGDDCLHPVRRGQTTTVWLLGWRRERPPPGKGGGSVRRRRRLGALHFEALLRRGGWGHLRCLLRLRSRRGAPADSADDRGVRPLVADRTYTAAAWARCRGTPLCPWMREHRVRIDTEPDGSAHGRGRGAAARRQQLQRAHRVAEPGVLRRVHRLQACGGGEECVASSCKFALALRGPLPEPPVVCLQLRHTPPQTLRLDGERRRELHRLSAAGGADTTAGTARELPAGD
eukprot:Hpha_TRINITY_DN12968_c0_g1::TRINITY_DN12968_c0_g1_i1::g.164302::m.164302